MVQAVGHGEDQERPLPVVTDSMRCEGLDLDNNGSSAFELPHFGNGSFSQVPGQRPGILEADEQNFFSKAVEVISADVTRQSCAEVNVADGTQEGKLPTLEGVTGPTPVPEVVEGEDTYHFRYYEAMRDLQFALPS
jgi:hypothetical protein